MIKRICNMCGKPFDMWDDAEGFRMHRQLGYGTKYDGDILELDLCCSCIETIIDSCTISPLESIHNKTE